MGEFCKYNSVSIKYFKNSEFNYITIKNTFLIKNHAGYLLKEVINNQYIKI